MQEMRFTEKQIMRFLVEHLVDMYGLDDDEAPDPDEDIDLRIDLYFKETKLWKDLHISDFMFRFERAFHFECSEDEWKELFGVDRSFQTEDEWIERVGQHLTFRKLVNFIAERAPYISFQPVTVIDRECAPAGAFYGMLELSERFYPAACQLTPSTRILDAFRGDALDRFWSELKWRTDNRLTELKSFWFLMKGCGCLVFWPVLLISVILFLDGNYLYPLLASVTSYTLWKVFSACKYWSNPLPAGIETFRDLAKLIAEHDCEAVCKSD